MLFFCLPPYPVIPGPRETTFSVTCKDMSLWLLCPPTPGIPISLTDQVCSCLSAFVFATCSFTEVLGGTLHLIWLVCPYRLGFFSKFPPQGGSFLLSFLPFFSLSLFFCFLLFLFFTPSSWQDLSSSIRDKSVPLQWNHRVTTGPPGVPGPFLKLQYLGHLMRGTDSLEKTLILGNIGGRKRRERQGMRWLDGFTDLMDTSLSKRGSWCWTGRPGVL